MISIGTAIIGGGVVGAALLRELAKDDPESTFLFEKQSRLGEGQTGRSSGVLHSGILYPPGTLKARLCARSNQSTFEFCARHGVAALRTGKLIVATRERELRELDVLVKNARDNDVPGVEWLTPAQVEAREPTLRVLAALQVPSAGITDPSALTSALAGLAEADGAHVLTGFEITRIEARSGGFEITGRHHGDEEQFIAERVINAAGLQAFDVERMLNPASTGQSRSLRGEYYRFNRTRRPDIGVSDRLVFPLHELVAATAGSKRIACIASAHLTPTFTLTADGGIKVGSTVRVGPIFYPTDDPEDVTGPRLPAELFAQQAAKYLPALTVDDLEPDSAGVMTSFETGGHRDFVIHRDENRPGAISLLGIGSPGLTCALGLASYVRELTRG